uniref:Ubiquitin-like protease family profile domain-containing protein n=1 Tax=Micromonas pusilla TaxID=38833 RepID=A0A7S0PPK7_MICPS
MEIVARDLESRRAELKSPLKELDGDLEAGPSAADIEAMEAELTRPISAAQAEAIERAHAPGPPSEVIASGTFTGQGALELTRRDVATMATGEWLNDEMVNFTIGAMADREMARCGGTQPRVHFFNTFFVGKLTAQGDGYDYGAVRRWTTRKKLGYDVLECDKVIVPVHQGIHWVLAVVDFKATCVRFYDSLLGDDKGLVEDLLRWVRDEWRNKKNADVDTESWSVEIPKDIPRQMNGCDCGVFMLKYADYIATGCPLTFHQRDMEYFRRRIVADAVEKGN